MQSKLLSKGSLPAFWRLSCPDVFWFILILCMLFKPEAIFAFQQQELRISGKVLAASDNTPLPGVSVTIKGSTRGTSTSVNGDFSLVVPSRDAVLVFTMVGFERQEVVVGSNTNLRVSLSSAVSSLEEVVVVGYGQQKKLNLTGAVETLKFDDAVNQPVTNSGQLMYGRFSGVQLTQGNGLAGNDASSIIIRGVGSFGGTTPLVVIDNIQYNDLQEFNNLSPSDIESVSVLKDASASAIYGARGANGVIVVTTKKGKKGSFSVDYNNYFGTQQATVIPKFLDAVDYVTLVNEKYRNMNGPSAPVRYSPEAIEAIRSGSLPDQYANTNWASAILQNAPIQQHYLSFMGGTERTTYRVSLGYLGQDAIVKSKFHADRYNLGINLNSDVAKWLNVSNVTNAYWTKFKGPAGGADAISGETGIINQFQRSAPTIPVRYSNGDYGWVDGAYQNVNFSYPIDNPLWRGFFGDNNSDHINVSERIGLKATLYKGLVFETSGSAILDFTNSSNFTPTFTRRDWEGDLVAESVVNTLVNGTSFDYRLMNENILRYNVDVAKDHHLGLMAGHSVIYDRNDGFSGSLQGFPTDYIQEFNGGGVLNPSVSGEASEVAWQSFFGRLNYNYKERYLFEANMRRDGSSKFGPEKRNGWFPSFSAGWNIGREAFLVNSKLISDLKLRASWGKLGNDRIGNYIWSQTYNTGLDYQVGTDVIVPAVAMTALANPGIFWESVKQFDIGVDLSMLNNRLGFTADYFKRLSSSVLYTNFPVPKTIGVTDLKAQNAAAMENSGLELSSTFRQNLGRFRLSLGANLTRMSNSNVTGLGPGGEETISGNTIIRIGVPFNAYYGYRMEGIFQTAEEVAAAPVQFGSNKTAPGDIRYADVSGPDGVPDGVINAEDRVVIGNPFPRWIYGFNTNLEYKGFDFGAVFQGIGNVDRLLFGNGQTPLDGDRNNALAYWTGRWTPENPSTELPRLGGVNNTQTSTFYIQDVSYLRMKNIELGYTLPVSLLKKASVQRLRIFLSGQNLLTFTKLKDFDPERERGGNSERANSPLYKVFTAGVNLKL